MSDDMSIKSLNHSSSEIVLPLICTNDLNEKMNNYSLNNQLNNTFPKLSLFEFPPLMSFDLPPIDELLSACPIPPAIKLQNNTIPESQKSKPSKKPNTNPIQSIVQQLTNDQKLHLKKFRLSQNLKFIEIRDKFIKENKSENKHPKSNDWHIKNWMKLGKILSTSLQSFTYEQILQQKNTFQKKLKTLTSEYDKLLNEKNAYKKENLHLNEIEIEVRNLNHLITRLREDSKMYQKISIEYKKRIVHQSSDIEHKTCAINILEDDKLLNIKERNELKLEIKQLKLESLTNGVMTNGVIACENGFEYHLNGNIIRRPNENIRNSRFDQLTGDNSKFVPAHKNLIRTGVRFQHSHKDRQRKDTYGSLMNQLQSAQNENMHLAEENLMLKSKLSNVDDQLVGIHQNTQNSTNVCCTVTNDTSHLKIRLEEERAVSAEWRLKYEILQRLNKNDTDLMEENVRLQSKLHIYKQRNDQSLERNESLMEENIINMRGRDEAVKEKEEYEKRAQISLEESKVQLQRLTKDCKAFQRMMIKLKESNERHKAREKKEKMLERQKIKLNEKIDFLKRQIKVQKKILNDIKYHFEKNGNGFYKNIDFSKLIEFDDGCNRKKKKKKKMKKENVSKLENKEIDVELNDMDFDDMLDGLEIVDDKDVNIDDDDDNLLFNDDTQIESIADEPMIDNEWKSSNNEINGNSSKIAYSLFGNDSESDSSDDQILICNHKARDDSNIQKIEDKDDENDSECESIIIKNADGNKHEISPPSTFISNANEIENNSDSDSIAIIVKKRNIICDRSESEEQLIIGMVDNKPDIMSADQISSTNEVKTNSDIKVNEIDDEIEVNVDDNDHFSDISDNNQETNQKSKENELQLLPNLTENISDSDLDFNDLELCSNNNYSLISQTKEILNISQNDANTNVNNSSLDVCICDDILQPPMLKKRKLNQNRNDNPWKQAFENLISNSSKNIPKEMKCIQDQWLESKKKNQLAVIMTKIIMNYLEIQQSGNTFAIIHSFKEIQSNIDKIYDTLKILNTNIENENDILFEIQLNLKKKILNKKKNRKDENKKHLFCALFANICKNISSENIKSKQNIWQLIYDLLSNNTPNCLTLISILLMYNTSSIIDTNPFVKHCIHTCIIHKTHTNQDSNEKRFLQWSANIYQQILVECRWNSTQTSEIKSNYFGFLNNLLNKEIHKYLISTKNQTKNTISGIKLIVNCNFAYTFNELLPHVLFPHLKQLFIVTNVSNVKQNILINNEKKLFIIELMADCLNIGCSKVKKRIQRMQSTDESKKKSRKRNRFHMEDILFKLTNDYCLIWSQMIFIAMVDGCRVKEEPIVIASLIYAVIHNRGYQTLKKTLMACNVSSYFLVQLREMLNLCRFASENPVFIYKERVLKYEKAIKGLYVGCIQEIWKMKIKSRKYGGCSFNRDIHALLVEYKIKPKKLSSFGRRRKKRKGKF